MASQNRQSTAAIEQAILNDASAFSFSKLITHLYCIVKAQGEDPSKKIRVRPALSMELSRAEIVDVSKSEQGIYEVTTNFLGLYGVSSPLPNFYTDELIALEQEDQTTARQFLDIIHQRLYQLYGQAQQKYNALNAVVEQQQSMFSQLLHTLTGSRDDALKKALPDPNQLLTYIGLLSSKQRSAQGLTTLLSGFLKGIKVSVEECVERVVSIPEKHLTCLGVNSCQLGNSALLGNQLNDRNAKITVHLGPLSQDDFDHIVNNKSQWGTIESLIKTYLVTPLEVDIKISLLAGAAQGVSLGQSQWCQLGYDTWLLNQSTDKQASQTTDLLVSTLRLQ